MRANFDCRQTRRLPIRQAGSRPSAYPMTLNGLASSFGASFPPGRGFSGGHSSPEWDCQREYPACDQGHGRTRGQIEVVGDVEAGHGGRGDRDRGRHHHRDKMSHQQRGISYVQHVSHNHCAAAIDRKPLSSDTAIRRSSGDQAKPAIGLLNIASASKTGFFFSIFQSASRPSLPPEASSIPRR